MSEVPARTAIGLGRLSLQILTRYQVSQRKTVGNYSIMLHAQINQILTRNFETKLSSQMLCACPISNLRCKYDLFRMLMLQMWNIVKVLWYMSTGRWTHASQLSDRNDEVCRLVLQRLNLHNNSF